MDGKIFYITKEKLQQLEKEHEELVAFEHTKVLGQEAPHMLESDDINPEFVSFQEDVGNLRAKIDALKDVLDHYELIKNPPKEKRDMVGIGACVKVDVNGKHNEFMIMGTLEANPELGHISNESPVGKALLGHKIGDEIFINAPEKTKYKIKSIKYEIS